MDTADNTASSSLLNSSKQPQAPHFTKPTNMRPIDFTSMPLKLKRNTNNKEVIEDYLPIKPIKKQYFIFLLNLLKNNKPIKKQYKNLLDLLKNNTLL